MTSDPTPVRLRDGKAVPTERRCAVFLDRDGVLNEVRAGGDASLPPTSVDDVRLVEGARALTGALRDAGYVLVVVTNQPDVARGTLTQDDAVAITEFVRSELDLDDGYVCPHDNDDGCDCRKPRPGMLRRAAVDWNLDLDGSWLIGDRWVDIGAAEAAGVRSLLVETPYSWAAAGGSLPPGNLVPEASFPGLAGCVGYLLATDRS